MIIEASAQTRAASPRGIEIGGVKLGQVESLKATDRRLASVGSQTRDFFDPQHNNLLRTEANSLRELRDYSIDEITEMAHRLQVHIAERLAIDNGGEQGEVIIRAINRDQVAAFDTFLGQSEGNIIIAARHGDQKPWSGAYTPIMDPDVPTRALPEKAVMMGYENNLYDPITTASLADAAAVRLIEEWAFARHGIVLAHEESSENYRALEAAIVQNTVSQTLAEVGLRPESHRLETDPRFDCLNYPSDPRQLKDALTSENLKPDGTIAFDRTKIDTVAGEGTFDATFSTMADFVESGLTNSAPTREAVTTTTQTQHLVAMQLNKTLADLGLTLEQYQAQQSEEFDAIAGFRRDTLAIQVQVGHSMQDSTRADFALLEPKATIHVVAREQAPKGTPEQPSLLQFADQLQASSTTVLDAVREIGTVAGRQEQRREVVEEDITIQAETFTTLATVTSFIEDLRTHGTLPDEFVTLVNDIIEGRGFLISFPGIAGEYQLQAERALLLLSVAENLLATLSRNPETREQATRLATALVKGQQDKNPLHIIWKARHDVDYQWDTLREVERLTSSSRR